MKKTVACAASEASGFAKSVADVSISLEACWAKVQPCMAELIARVADCQPLKSICARDDMPSFLAVHRCLVEDTAQGDILDFRVLYDTARSAMAHNAVDEMVTIADRPILSHTDALKQGQQIRARQFVAERVAPKSYAPARREVVGKISATDLADALESAANIIQQRRNQRMSGASANAESAPLPQASPEASQ